MRCVVLCCELGLGRKWYIDRTDMEIREGVV